MLRITRLADYAVLIICSFEGNVNKVISAPEIIKSPESTVILGFRSILVSRNLLIFGDGKNCGKPDRPNVER